MNFYPRPPRGGRRASGCSGRKRRNFYPRPPRGGRRVAVRLALSGVGISIHALREEGDIISVDNRRKAERFLSTPSARRATWTRAGRTAARRFLSTPSARRATTSAGAMPGRSSNFYPRPPRGGRPPPLTGVSENTKISIHALREEGDHDLFHSPGFVYEFLSTPSARRATIPVRRTVWLSNDFYPRPPRGGRRTGRTTTNFRLLISIHALREEGDDTMWSFMQMGGLFLSTPSARRATSGLRHETLKPHNFYPRPPRGGRPSPLHLHFIFLLFLSTPSARRATLHLWAPFFAPSISIHALREEGDLTRPRTAKAAYDFYPRPPRGGRPTTALFIFRR